MATADSLRHIWSILHSHYFLKNSKHSPFTCCFHDLMLICIFKVLMSHTKHILHIFRIFLCRNLGWISVQRLPQHRYSLSPVLCKSFLKQKCHCACILRLHAPSFCHLSLKAGTRWTLCALAGLSVVHVVFPWALSRQSGWEKSWATQRPQLQLHTALAP